MSETGGVPIASYGARARPDVAFLLPELGAGGVERVFGNYAAALAAQGKRVDLVLLSDRRRVAPPPAGVRVVNLAAPVRGDATFALALPALVRYLKRERPGALCAGITSLNLLAVLARGLAGGRGDVPADVGAPGDSAGSSARRRTTVLVSEHVPPSVNAGTHPLKRLLPLLMRRFYPQADAVVAVSEALAADLASVARLPRSAITTLYNPVVDERLLAEAQARPDHPWFSGPEPVIVGMGRLHPQKDFVTLLRAFALLRQRQAGKLLILGEGEQRHALEAEARRLGVAEHVAMPGHVSAPGAFLAHADLFALSSLYEGFPTVLIEALACGCPVVATDCPTGPHEILEGGRYGALVPPARPEALAEAMLATLASPPPAARSMARGRTFTVEAATERLWDLLEAVSDPAA